MTPKTSRSVCAEAPALFSGEAPNETVEQTHSEGIVSSTSHHHEGRALSRSMSLFELDESLFALMESAMEAAGESNGEIPAELQQALLDYCEAFGQKVDNIASYLRSQEFEA